MQLLMKLAVFVLGRYTGTHAEQVSHQPGPVAARVARATPTEDKAPGMTALCVTPPVERPEAGMMLDDTRQFARRIGLTWTRRLEYGGDAALAVLEMNRTATVNELEKRLKHALLRALDHGAGDAGDGHQTVCAPGLAEPQRGAIQANRGAGHVDV